jgi:ELWxxDGT repeat protein
MDRREAEGQPWIPRWQFEWRRTFAGRTSQRTPPLYRGYDRLPGGRDVMTRRRLMSVGLLLLILVASFCIRLVKDIARGPNGSDPSAPTVVSEVLYFVADDESRGSEIWRSDGTEAGTVLVRYIAPGRRLALGSCRLKGPGASGMDTDPADVSLVFSLVGWPTKRGACSGHDRVAAGKRLLFWSGRRDSNPRPPPWQGC